MVVCVSSIAFSQYFLCLTLGNVFLSSFCPIWYAIEIDNCQAARPRRSLDILGPSTIPSTPPHSLPTDSRLCITITVI